LVSVAAIPAEYADFADEVWGYAMRGLRHGASETEATLRAAVARGDAQLWAATRGGKAVGGFVTEILDRPRGRFCVIIVAGGTEITAEGCADVLEQITPWARSCGCEQFEINGRKGWARHLKDKRWHTAHVTYRRAI
jgi:hypothetical protein